MLQRLGRWLRTAGYDTEIISDGRRDYELLKQARKEGRLLLTCDKALSEYRDAQKHVVVLNMGTLNDFVAQLSEHCHINWQYQPFSRCINCNSELQEANSEQRNLIPHEVPPEQVSELVYYCAQCNKVYWDGGHVERMRLQLEKWQTQFSSEKSSP